jgi:DNA repair protein RadD
MNNLKNDLVQIIKRLSRPQFEQWFNHDTLKIFDNTIGHDYDLSELVLIKHGIYSLSFKKIREFYTDTFSDAELEIFAKQQGLKKINRIEASQFANFITLFNLSNIWAEPKNTSYTSIGNVNPAYKFILESQGAPHFYQKKIKQHCHHWFNNDALGDNCLVSMPTGSGKTRLANEFIIDLLRSDRVTRVLWLAHRRELLYQSALSFKKLWIEKGDHQIKLNLYFDKLDEWFSTDSSEIVYASYDKLNGTDITNSNIDLIIVDEAHYTLAETYSELVFKLIHTNNSKLLGLTATPLRSDDEIFLNIINTYGHHINISEILKTSDPISLLQQLDYLANINYSHLNIPHAEFHEQSKTLNDAIIQKCNSFKDRSKNILIFAMSLSHAVALTVILNKVGIANGCIVGDTPIEERNVILSKFQERELTALINYDILTTGVDIPGMDGVLILRNFRERHTAIQVIGRALRGKKNGGNQWNDVIYINAFSTQNINDLYNF